LRKVEKCFLEIAQRCAKLKNDFYRLRSVAQKRKIVFRDCAALRNVEKSFLEIAQCCAKKKK
jgi:hypothetical protein